MKFDPYQKWLNVPDRSASTTHYELLGLQAFESDPTRIRNAYDRASAEVHKWEGSSKYADAATRILNELADAYSCLNESQAKREYDRQLQSRTTASDASVAAETVSEGPSLEDLLEEYSPVVGGPQTGHHLTPASLPARKTQPPATRFPLPLVVGSILAGIVLLALGAAFVLSLRDSTTELAGTRGAGTVPGDSPQNATPAGEATDAALGSSSDDRQATEPSATLNQAEIHEREASPLANPFSDAAAVTPPPDLADSASGRTWDPSARPSPGMSDLGDAQPTSFDDERLAPDKAKPGSDTNVPAGSTLADTNPEPRKLSAVRLRPPSLDVQNAVIAQISERYHPERAASAAAKTRLAKQLLDLADQSSDKQDERFVLLRTAVQLCCDACDVGLMMQTIDTLAADYDVLEPDVHAHMLKLLLADGKTPERVMAFLRNCDPVISRAIAVDKLDLAVEMADLAGGLCDRPVGSAQFRKEIQERQARVQRIGEQFQQHQAALAKLAAAPDDADAHATAGRWLCLVKGDWDQGLPHLSQGSEPRLKRLAEQELSAADAAPDVLVALGDGWREMAQSAEAHEQVPILRRADDGYRRAAEALSGSAKAEVNRRREEIGHDLARLAPGEVQPTGLPDAAQPSPASAEEAEESESQDLQGLFERALAAGMSGNNFAQAERLLSRCNQLDRQHVPTLNNLALMSLRLKSYRRAVHLWETAAGLAPENAAIKHNLQCLLRLAQANRLPMDRSVVSSVELLCGKAKGNDTPGGRSYDGWVFMPYGQSRNLDSSYTDNRCLHCGGTGTVACNAPGCNGGTVGVQQARVVGRAHTGEPILKNVTVRVRCSHCSGRGIGRCPSCGGTGRSSY